MSEFAKYATAKPSDTMDAFADWLIAEVFDGKLPKGIDLESFKKGVQLGGSTRGYFQKSEWWKADSRNYLNNVEARRAAKAAEQLEKANAAAKKAADRIAKLEALVAAAKAKAEPEVDQEAIDAEAAAAESAA